MSIKVCYGHRWVQEQPKSFDLLKIRAKSVKIWAKYLKIRTNSMKIRENSANVV